MGDGVQNIKRVVQLVSVIACIAVLALLAVADNSIQTDYLTNVKFSSGDGIVQVTWDAPLLSRVSEVKITVSGNAGNFTEAVSPYENKYEFTSGEHGMLYNLSLNEIHKDGSVGTTYSDSFLFLDYAQLPDFPTVYIETDTGEDPTGEAAEKPNELLWGATTVNNDYVPGNMTFVWKGHETVSSKLELRIRGNTSSMGEKKSYKLRLNNSEDMLDMGAEHADTEWLLLNVGYKLNNYLGEYLSELCGMEWISHSMLVNVMLNGDWKGMYYLSEAVKRGQTRGNVSETGYIFENDAYWWTPDRVFFKLSSQIYQLGFTFKYPEFANSNDKRITDLQQYMETVTGFIMSFNEDALNYIDTNTFAAWVMVRDIMHSGDGGGSNMYYYMYDLNSGDYAANKLKMGPVWDFDGGMKGAESWHDDITGWSDSHASTITYFPYLFEMPQFRAVYKDKWEQVSSELTENYDAYMEKLLLSQGAEINESRKLNSARWGGEMTSIEDELAYNSDFIHQRIAWIDSAVEDW